MNDAPGKTHYFVETSANSGEDFLGQVRGAALMAVSLHDRPGWSTLCELCRLVLKDHRHPQWPKPRGHQQAMGPEELGRDRLRPLMAGQCREASRTGWGIEMDVGMD
jgi:hypothetical protein